jgi:tRNA uridine 5-carbamoylmethylation protein Kti12
MHEAVHHRVEVRHVCFDEHGCQPELDGDACGSSEGHAAEAAHAFSPEAWREARQYALAQVEAELRLTASQQLMHESSKQASMVTADHQSSAGSDQAQQQQQQADAAQPRLVIADDNMQYRSMRGECYALARAAGAAIVLLYLQCAETLAQQRNSSRPAGQRVPLDVIRRMAAQLEEPGTGSSDGSQWEQGCLLVLSSCEAAAACQHGTAVLWQRIWHLWGPPAPPPYDAHAAAAARAAAQAATAANRLHSVDLATRHLLSQAMQRIQAGPPQRKAAAAQQLNSMRRSLLQRAQQASASAPDELLATDHWVAMFQQQCTAALDQM